MSTATAPSSSGAAMRVERLTARVAALDHLVIMRVFLGALFITVFFENLAFGRYTPGGYERLIERYAARNNAPGFWSNGVMGFFADHSEIFSKLQAVTEMSFGIALVIGFAAGYLGFAVAGFLLALWLSELGLFWIWELPGLIFVALALLINSAGTGGNKNGDVTLRAAVVFGAALTALALVDNARRAATRPPGG